MIIKHNQKAEVINIRQMNIYQPKIFFGNGKRSVFDFFSKFNFYYVFSECFVVSQCQKTIELQFVM